MVTTRASSRASSREATPVDNDDANDYVRRLRGGSRRSETPARGVTPRRGRSVSHLPSAAPQVANAGSGARAGVFSNAYGIGAASIASRMTDRGQDSLSAAFDNELGDQDPIHPIAGLASVVEEDYASSPVESRASSRDSSVSRTARITQTSYYFEREAKLINAKNQFDHTEDSTSASGNVLGEKSYSDGREAGVVGQPSHLVYHPHGTPTPSYLTRVWTTIRGFFVRIFATIYHGLVAAKDFIPRHQQLFSLALLVLLLVPAIYYGLSTAGNVLSKPTDTIFDDGPSGTQATVTATVTSYIADPTIESRLNAYHSRLASVEKKVQYLQDSIPQSHHSEKLFNWISAAGGATIIPAMTSPTKPRVLTRGLWGLALSKIWTPPGQTYPIDALKDWNEPGECWCTPTEKASLGVRIPQPIQASAITIEHVTTSQLLGSGRDRSTAPRVVEVFARGEGAEEGSGRCEEVVEGWTCLGRLNVLFQGDERDVTLDLEVKTSVASEFAVKVVRNDGNREATCLYRVLMHGDAVVRH